MRENTNNNSLNDSNSTMLEKNVYNQLSQDLPKYSIKEVINKKASIAPITIITEQQEEKLKQITSGNSHNLNNSDIRNCKLTLAFLYIAQSDLFPLSNKIDIAFRLFDEVKKEDSISDFSNIDIGIFCTQALVKLNEKMSDLLKRPCLEDKNTYELIRAKFLLSVMKKTCLYIDEIDSHKTVDMFFKTVDTALSIEEPRDAIEILQKLKCLDGDNHFNMNDNFDVNNFFNRNIYNSINYKIIDSYIQLSNKLSDNKNLNSSKPDSLLYLRHAKDIFFQELNITDIRSFKLCHKIALNLTSLGDFHNARMCLKKCNRKVGRLKLTETKIGLESTLDSAIVSINLKKLPRAIAHIKNFLSDFKNANPNLTIDEKIFLMDKLSNFYKELDPILLKTHASKDYIYNLEETQKILAPSLKYFEDFLNSTNLQHLEFYIKISNELDLPAPDKIDIIKELSKPYINTLQSKGMDGLKENLRAKNFNINDDLLISLPIIADYYLCRARGLEEILTDRENIFFRNKNEVRKDELEFFIQKKNLEHLFKIGDFCNSNKREEDISDNNLAIENLKNTLEIAKNNYSCLVFDYIHTAFAMLSIDRNDFVLSGIDPEEIDFVVGLHELLSDVLSLEGHHDLAKRHTRFLEDTRYEDDTNH